MSGRALTAAARPGGDINLSPGFRLGLFSLIHLEPIRERVGRWWWWSCSSSVTTNQNKRVDLPEKNHVS